MSNNKEQEQEQLNTLMGKGVEVPIGGGSVIIKEPTLAVLDAMSAHWIEFPDLSEVTTTDDVRTAVNDIKPYIKPMAEVVAMAILGERQFGIFGRLRLWLKTRWVYHHIQPHELKDLCEIITATNGLVPFIISMRLMSAARTTATKNIES